LTGLSGWTEERWNELRATYYGMCARLDHQYGMVLEVLTDAGILNDTAVFFFSDHGAYVGDFDVVDINQNTFEDCMTRVPLVVKPPADVDVTPGVRDALVELVDFPATVFDLLGITPDHWHFGRSLLGVIGGAAADHRDAVFSEGGRLSGEIHCKELEYAPGTVPGDLYYPRLIFQAGDGPEHTKAIMCRTRDVKYVMRLYEQDELYDLKRDPAERANRIDDPAMADVLAQMKDRLLRFYLETGDVVPMDTDQRDAP
jgi:arylsulfatase A-like enzyme